MFCLAKFICHSIPVYSLTSFARKSYTCIQIILHLLLVYYSFKSFSRISQLPRDLYQNTQVIKNTCLCSLHRDTSLNDIQYFMKRIPQVSWIQQMEQKNNQPVKNTCKCKQNLGISFLSCPITSYLSKIFYMDWKYRLFIGKAVHCIL